MNTRLQITTLANFKDILITDNRPKQIGLHEIELLTDDVYRRIDNTDYIQQPVQSMAWDKYQIQLIGIEDAGYELLKYAKSIILTYGEDVHFPKILDVQREQAGNSDLSLITIEYYDTRLDNYPDGLTPVYEFLKSDSLASQFSFSEMNVLRVIDEEGEHTDFNTMLEIVSTSKQPEKQAFSNTQTGETVTTNAVIKKQFEGVFFLNKTDVQIFQNTLPLADGVKIQAYYHTGLAGYPIKEMPEVAVEKLSGYDIWKCTVNFVYSVVNHFSYENI